jgi:hypothetical protein
MFMGWTDDADGAARDLGKGAAAFVEWNNDPLVVCCDLDQVAIRVLRLYLVPLGSSCNFCGAQWWPEVVLRHEFGSRACLLVWTGFWQVASAILSVTCVSQKHARIS